MSLTMSIEGHPVLVRGNSPLAVYCGADLYLAGEIAGTAWIAYVHGKTCKGVARDARGAANAIAVFWLVHRDIQPTGTDSQRASGMRALEDHGHISELKPIRPRLKPEDFQMVREWTGDVPGSKQTEGAVSAKE